MKRLVYILFAWVCSCAVERDFSQEEKAIYGLWVAGEAPKIQAVIFENGSYALSFDEQFEIEFSDGEIGRFGLSDDYYELQTGRLPQAGERVVLRWLNDRDTALATVVFPPKALLTGVQNDTLLVTSEQNAIIDWNEPTEGVEFALQLECTENEPIPLPGGAGNFNQLYAGPQVASQVELSKEAFSFFGMHTLRISVLNDDLVALFFFDPSDIRGLLKNGPDNVIGGKGFISAITTTDVLLEIE